MHVGVVGATGAAGAAMVEILATREFPLERLRVFASERSAGREVEFRGERLVVEDAATAEFTGL